MSSDIVVVPTEIAAFVQSVFRGTFGARPSADSTVVCRTNEFEYLYFKAPGVELKVVDGGSEQSYQLCSLDYAWQFKRASDAEIVSALSAVRDNAPRLYQSLTSLIDFPSQDVRDIVERRWEYALDRLEEEFAEANHLIGPLPERPGLPRAESIRPFRGDRVMQPYPSYRPSSLQQDGPRPVVALSQGTVVYLRDATGATMLPVKAGEVDDAAKHMYRNGHCHAFAYALHEATGWPIYAVKTTRNDGARRLAHFALETPNGDLLDISGRQTKEAMRSSFVEDNASTTLEPLSDSDLFNVMNSIELPGSYYQEPQMELARSFVAPVLRSEGYFAEATRAEHRFVASSVLRNDLA